MRPWKRMPQSIKTSDGYSVKNPFDLQAVVSHRVHFKLRKDTALYSSLKFSWSGIGTKLISRRLTLTICVGNFFLASHLSFLPLMHLTPQRPYLTSPFHMHMHIYIYIFHWFVYVCPEYDSLWAYFSVWFCNHRLVYSGCQDATNNISINFLKNSKPWTKNI